MLSQSSVLCWGHPDPLSTVPAHPWAWVLTPVVAYLP